MLILIKDVKAILFLQILSDLMQSLFLVGGVVLIGFFIIDGVFFSVESFFFV